MNNRNVDMDSLVGNETSEKNQKDKAINYSQTYQNFSSDFTVRRDRNKSKVPQKPKVVPCAMCGVRWMSIWIMQRIYRNDDSTKSTERSSSYINCNMFSSNFITLTALFLLHLLHPWSAKGFQVTTTNVSPMARVRPFICYATVGGWGIGPSKEMKDEEFSNSAKRRNRKRRDPDEMASYGRMDVDKAYELEDSISFSEKIKKEKQGLKDAQMKDLMKIAQIAGIGKSQKANGADKNLFEKVDRMGKFGPDLTQDDKDDNLDVRVTWDQ